VETAPAGQSTAGPAATKEVAVIGIVVVGGTVVGVGGTVVGVDEYLATSGVVDSLAESPPKTKTATTIARTTRTAAPMFFTRPVDMVELSVRRARLSTGWGQMVRRMSVTWTDAAILDCNLA
jgi:hypothetical protein